MQTTSQRVAVGLSLDDLAGLVLVPEPVGIEHVLVVPAGLVPVTAEVGLALVLESGGILLAIKVVGTVLVMEAGDLACVT